MKLAGVAFLVAVRLPGTIAIRGNLIEWKLASGVSLNELLKGQPAERRVRVTLKGYAIWNEPQGGPRRYLDGQAVGQPGVRVRAGKNVPRTDLVFPSGSGVRASDFESWLFVPAELGAPGPTLTDFNFDHPSLIAGDLTQGSLTLSGPAPADLTIALTASPRDPVADLPDEVKVRAGQVFAEGFALKTKPNVAGTVFVQAKLDGKILSFSVEVTVVTVEIAPRSATVVIGRRQQFTATVKGSDDPAVTWRVEGAGRVTATGLYMALPGESGAQVIAQSSADPSKSATAEVVIVSP